jgi:hypothetical protein
MSKVDFKKTLKHLYNPPKKFVLVEVPEMQFLMIDGEGDPNQAQEYKDALEALYSVAYKVKFISKKSLEKDYTVPPLEGLWWADDMDTFAIKRDKSQWKWTMMIMTPDWIISTMINQAIDQVRHAKNPISLEKVRLETYQEGLSVQIMHVGSFDDEAPVLDEMHKIFIPQNGYIVNGLHHEIYLSDPRRVVPEKLKTVLRQPITKKSELS